MHSFVKEGAKSASTDFPLGSHWMASVAGRFSVKAKTAAIITPPRRAIFGIASCFPFKAISQYN